MLIGGIAWWLLTGMFGFGAAIGLIVSLAVARKLVKTASGDWWGPLFEVFFALAGIAVAMPLAGIAAVGVTFAAYHVGWQKPLPYLAGIGLVFLTLAAGWILHILVRPSSSR